MTVRRAVFLWIPLFAATASAQTRDLRPATRATSVIVGTVVSDDLDQKPVRHVRVTCSGSDVSATAITDDRGRFTFSGLKAGRYMITGVKDAWITTAYGAKRPTRPGSAIPLAEGQTATITLRMLRGSAITGSVFDYNNQPAANTIVSAMRYMIREGTRRLSPFASAVSDDRGVYRIFGLPPGDYYIGAAARGAAPGTPGELHFIDDRTRSDRTVSFASTYYPGTVVSLQAVPVSLGPAQERDGIDFTLQLVPTARVEGSVTMTDGSPGSSSVQVDLIASSQATFPGSGFSAIRSTRAGADGTFRFVDVGPGTYTVLARGGTPIAWAASEIAVDGDPISGLSLALQPGMTMTGEIRFDATRLKPPADLSSLRLSLQPVQAQTSVNVAPSGRVIDQSGRFEIKDILPGRYRLSVSLPGLGSPGHWFLRSALVGGQDTLDVPIDIRPGEITRDAIVLLSDRPAQLTGTVHNTAGGAANEFTVILFSADQALWLPQSRRTFGVRPSADGAFSFRGLVPGDYFIAAIDDVEPNEWFDPALLQRLMATAMKLSIGEGEHKVQDLQLNK